MTNILLSRTGQIQGAGSELALFLKLGSTELIGAWERATVFKDKVTARSIRGGKSLAFPVMGRRTAAYHTPGTPLLGDINDPSDLNEQIINLDALMVADESVYDLDRLMNYWDDRADLMRELGRALAREYDARAARVIYGAAKTATPQLAKAINADRVGQSKTLSAGYAAASANAKGDELIAAISEMKRSMQSKDVPTDDLYCVVGPDEYDYLLDSTRAINTDFNGGDGNGSFASGRVLRVKGIPVYWSNHVTQAAYTNVTGDRNTDYQQDLSKCVALLFHRSAIGVLSLVNIQLEMTNPSGDFHVQYQSELVVAKMAIGMGKLRPEAAAAIELP